MRSTVYFADLRATTKVSFVDKIGRLVDTAGLSDCLKKRDLAAVKLHFGELGNTAFIRPVAQLHCRLLSVERAFRSLATSLY